MSNKNQSQASLVGHPGGVAFTLDINPGRQTTHDTVNAEETEPQLLCVYWDFECMYRQTGRQNTSNGYMEMKS